MTRNRFPYGLIPALLLAGVAFAACGGEATVDGVMISGPTPTRGFETIDSTAIRARTAYLASDLMEGRAPAARGGRLAAEYIASEFQSFGLHPISGATGAGAGDDGGRPGGEGAPRGAPGLDAYYQMVPILGVTPQPTLSFRSADGRSRFQPSYLSDFVAWTPTQQEEVEVDGEVVFVGYGIRAPEHDWNDYRGVDVQGKILLGMVNDPGGTGESDGFRGDTLTYYGRWTYKFEEAERQGAAGMILVHTPETAGYGWSVVRNSWSGEQFEIPLAEDRSPPPLEAWVTAGAARRLLGLVGVGLDSLMAEAGQPGFRARALPLRASSRIRSEIQRTESPNVVAMIPGRDSTLREEVVVYTSHYDHLGVGTPSDGDSIYNGAKDNASGTAAIMEIARAYASLPERPRRTVMFAAVTAEESGLLGSEYLAGHPPMGRFVADVNMDAINMYGRTGDIVQLGGDHSSMGETFRQVASYLDLTVRGDQSPGQGHFFRSDQFSFVNRGVPSLYVEQGVDYVGEPEGTGEDREAAYRSSRYHQPADEMLPEYTMGGAAQQSGVAFLLGWVLANAQEPPTWNPDSPFGGS